MDATEELALLAAAFVLSSIIGFEREIRQRSAGLKTHTLVGVGAALFTLAGRFGFSDGAAVDPSRVAAQVVSGIGFIGAGVVFVVSNVGVTRDDERSDVVAVSLDAEGKRLPGELVSALQRVDGVVEVRSSEPTE